MTEFTDNQREFWYKMAKTRPGHKRLFIPKIVFSILDLILLLGNVITYLNTGNYFAAFLIISFNIMCECLAAHFYALFNKQTNQHQDVDNNEEAEQSNAEEQNRIICCNIKDMFKTENYNSILECVICRMFGLTTFYWIKENWSKFKENHEIIRQGRIHNSKSISHEEIQAQLWIKQQLLINSSFQMFSAYLKNMSIAIFYMYLLRDASYADLCHLGTHWIKMASILIAISMGGWCCKSHSQHLWELSKCLEFKKQRDQMNHNRQPTLINYVIVIRNVSQIALRLSFIGIFIQQGYVFVGICLILWNWIFQLLFVSYIPSLKPLYENPSSGGSPSLLSFKNIFQRYVNVYCFNDLVPTMFSIIVYDLSFWTCASVILYSCLDKYSDNVHTTTLTFTDLSWCTISILFNYKWLDKDNHTVSSYILGNFDNTQINNYSVAHFAINIFFTVSIALGFVIIFVNYKCKLEIPVVIENSVHNWKRLIIKDFYQHGSLNTKYLLNFAICEKDSDIEVKLKEISQRSPLIQNDAQFSVTIHDSNPLYPELRRLESFVKSTNDFNVWTDFVCFVENFDGHMKKMSSHRLRLIFDAYDRASQLNRIQ